MSSVLTTISIAEEARARVWEEVIGQDHITRKLINCLLGLDGLSLNRYLLLVSRVSGCGKTSVARLIGRRLLCENRRGDNTEGLTDWHNPCNVCKNCTALLKDPLSLPGGYVEYDCASESNKAGLITSMSDWTRQNALYGYKIILLDEIHALSRDAQDALLASLEGLYRNAKALQLIFILATREPDKLKDALVNRGMSYSFAPLGEAVIVQRISQYLTSKGITYEDEAVEIVAKSCGGSMRLAYNSLERLLQERRPLTAVYVATECRSITKDQRKALWRSIATSDVAVISRTYDSWINSIGDPKVIARSLLEDLNNTSTLTDREQVYAVSKLDMSIQIGTPECIKHAVLGLKGLSIEVPKQTFKEWLLE